MALEQWEIDLRKQLEGKSDGYINNISIKAPQPKQNKQSDVLPLFIVLMLLGCTTLFLINQQNNGSLKEWVLSKFKSVEKTDEKTELLLKLIDNSKSVDSRLDKLSNKITINEDKITVIGMLLNENFAILKHKQDQSDFILLNRDWTLNKMPKYLSLSDSDKEYLQKYVK